MSIPFRQRVAQRGEGLVESDINQLATARLLPRRPRAERHAQQIAWHEAEIQHLRELAHVMENAITARVFRLHITQDRTLHEALEQNRSALT